MTPRRRRRRASLRVLVPAVGLLLLAACGPATPSGSPTVAGGVSPSAAPSPGIGPVIPAPGSDSRIFGPNPGAIVVALDAGHGGCLDWGVPNPYDNTVARAEKTLTLAVALAARELLEAEGVTVVMTRESDVALAGDLYPEHGCHGEPFRDVNGDGMAGFGPSVPDATRTRDELSARIDLVNLARADVLLSIHVNSLTENGQVLPLAGTETYWTDETPWGAHHSERLALTVQDRVVAAMAEVAGYDRQDRGIDAVNYYIIAPAGDGTDPSQPRRGSLMPGVLAEVGSMSLDAEAALLATRPAQQAIAAALVEALVDWFAGRRFAARFDLDVPDGEAGTVPAVRPGSGPPFWPAEVSAAAALTIRLTNTGSDPWPPDVRLMAGWAPTEDPYLATPPVLAAVEIIVPALAPGEAVNLDVVLPQPPAAGQSVAWITLEIGDERLSDLGVPALQVVWMP